MDIIEPKRNPSLEPFTLAIMEYTHVDKAPGQAEISPIYGFTTLADLKREIWVRHGGKAEWSPNKVWIAVKNAEDDLFKPLDMQWEQSAGFTKGIESPFLHPGVPDKRLVDGTGHRKAVYPQSREGLLLESVIKPDDIIHVWNVSTVLKALKSAKKVVSDTGVFEGYIKLYFPKIKDIEELLDDSVESYETVKSYIKSKNERLAAINEQISTFATPSNFRMVYLRKWRLVIDKVQKKSLELMFYNFATSKSLPFLRYFPEYGHGEPLLKLAVNTAGFPIISNTHMLNSFLDDEPDRSFGSVLMAKIPFETLAGEIQQKRNIALTIYWHDDGTCSIVLEGPRKEMPIETKTVEEAKILIHEALQSVGYTEDLKLEALNACYRIDITGTKITADNIQQRVAYFSPFLETSSLKQGKSSQEVFLKWKVVDNYEQEGAVYTYISRTVAEARLEADFSLEETLQIITTGIVREFGRTKEDAIELLRDWQRNHGEYMDTGSNIVQSHNMGVDIQITLSAPLYLLEFTSIDSEKTLSRCITVLTAFLYHTPTKGDSKEIVEPAVQETLPAHEVEAVEQVEAVARPEVMQEFAGLFGDEEEEEEETQEPQQEKQKEVPKEEKKQDRLQKTAAHITLPSLSSFYGEQFDIHDKKLVDWSETEAKQIIYSRSCQTHTGRQPNVMSAEKLKEIKIEYGDAVDWIHLPIDEKLILNIKKMAQSEIIDKLKTKYSYSDKDIKGKKKQELQTILETFVCAGDDIQGKLCRILSKDYKPVKPVWYVLRAGTEIANYYICAEYWCVKDMRPLIPLEFKSNVTNKGLDKDTDSCPFCGGKLIENMSSPKRGETVFRRKEKENGEIHPVVGYHTDIHPEHYAIPCCFVGPKIDKMRPEDTTKPLPADELELAQPVKEQEEEEEHGDEGDEADIMEDVSMKKVLRTMRTQYVIGQDKRKLEPGKIGLFHPALDKLFGQDSSKSVKREISQKFNEDAKIFVRIGLKNKGTLPGQGFLDLLGFYLGNLREQEKGGAGSVVTGAATLNEILKSKNIKRAFERANYGNLVHEFAGTGTYSGNLTTFAKELDIELNEKSRPFVQRLAAAWTNFVTYLNDETAPKKLEHFENIMAIPKVIYPDGVILVIFEGTLSEEDGSMDIKIRCPSYGINTFNQMEKNRPPMAFVWYDTINKNYEPIIYVEGKKAEGRGGRSRFVVLSTFHKEDKKMEEIDTHARSAITQMVEQYLSYEEGCGRYNPPPHPWTVDDYTFDVPKISDILAVEIPEYKADSVLRDCSNRLVGVIWKHGTQKVHFFIPVLEDGSMGLNLKSVYDIESIPLPSMDQLFMFLSSPELISTFPQLSPKEILVHEDNYCAVRLECDSIIPFFPETTDPTIRRKQKKPVEIYRYTSKLNELMKRPQKVAFLPWQEDARFLCPKKIEKAKEFEIIPETVMEEAYQYLRISFSEWLNSGKPNPKAVLNQLLLLRTANLPLFEIRRRADILLEPLIHNWLTVSDHKEAIPILSILRKNCIILKSEASCESSPMCSWIQSEDEEDEEEKGEKIKKKKKHIGLEKDKQCKIKIPQIETVPDVKVYFTNRLIDEIFRYKRLSEEIFSNQVSKIRRPVGLYRTKDYIISSKSKIDDLTDEMDLRHVPSEPYSAGLSFPEDAHDYSLGRKLRPYLIELPVAWSKAGIFRVPVKPIDNRFLQSLLIWTSEASKESIEQKIKEQRDKGKTKPVQWNDKDWWNFGKAYDVNIFQTKYDEEDEDIPVMRFLKTTETDNYAIVLYTLSDVEILLSRKKPLKLADLPRIFHNYLDSGVAVKYADL